MKEWLTIVTEGGIVLIDWLALIIIIVGTIEAFFRGLHLMFSSQDINEANNPLTPKFQLVSGVNMQVPIGRRRLAC